MLVHDPVVTKRAFMLRGASSGPGIAATGAIAEAGGPVASGQGDTSA